MRAKLGRWWSARPRSYPSVDEVARLSAEALAAKRGQTTSRIERTVLTLLGFGTYCLVALESPDSLLLLENPSVRLPFVDNEISFAAFLLVGPILLLGIWLYLNIHVTHRRLETAAMQQAGVSSPDVSEARHPFVRAVFGFTYFAVAPLVMADFAYKAAAVPGYGVWMMLAAVLVIWVHVLAATRALRSPRRRLTARIVTSVAVIMLLARIWAIGGEIRRPYDLYRANLEGAFLPQADLRGAYAARANLEGAILIEANLAGIDLGNARLAGADLSGAKLMDARFGWADLQKVNLSRANLSGARFIHTSLRGANLVSADLTGAYINGTDGEGADFSFARLDGATIEDSSFRAARFQKTSLEGTQDSQVHLGGPSLTPEKGVQLSTEQQNQIDTTRETKPIYGSDGKIIGDGRERTFSREDIGNFFKDVEKSQTPPDGAPPDGAAKPPSDAVQRGFEPDIADPPVPIPSER
jgi:hypothetical protein